MKPKLRIGSAGERILNIFSTNDDFVLAEPSPGLYVWTLYKEPMLSDLELIQLLLTIAMDHLDGLGVRVDLPPRLRLVRP